MWIGFFSRTKKGSYSPLSDGDAGSLVLSAEVPDRSTVSMGSASRGMYIPSACTSITESCRMRKYCHSPAGTGPEFPGRYQSQGHAVKACDLPLVSEEGLTGVREQSLRTLHFHEHDPEVFDDNEIKGMAPPPVTFSTLPRRPAISTASVSALNGRRPRVIPRPRFPAGLLRDLRAGSQGR